MAKKIKNQNAPKVVLDKLRGMDTKALTAYVHDSKKQLLQSRINRVAQKAEDPNLYRQLKRHVARAYTVLGEKSAVGSNAHAN